MLLGKREVLKKDFVRIIFVGFMKKKHRLKFQAVLFN